MKRYVLMLAAAACAAVAQQAAVPVHEEPLHQLIIDNAQVRVFRVEVPPGGRTLLHRHERDYLFVTLGDADVVSARAGGPAMRYQFKDGETAYTAGGFAHVAINQAPTPFRNITVEVVKEKPEAQGKPWAALAGAGMSVTVMVDNERAVALLYELAPGATMPRHTHTRPHLAVAVTDVELESDDAERGQGKMSQKAGDAVWVEALATHTLKNTGTKPARFVTIELK